MAERDEEVSLTGEVSEAGDPQEPASDGDAPPGLEGASSDANLPGNGATQAAAKDRTKIDILLKATGNAPIMKKKKWAVSQDQHIGWISEFIKKYLKLDPGERLFLYINQTFAPAPDQTVKNLYNCYGTDGKLVIHYCKSQAWG